MKGTVLGILFRKPAAAQMSGTFKATGSMKAPRASHTASLLLSRKVLIAGGPSAVELYDPSTGTSIASGVTAASNSVVLATLLPDGRVLLIETRNAELYDPSSYQVNFSRTTRRRSRAGDDSDRRRLDYRRAGKHSSEMTGASR